MLFLFYTFFGIVANLIGGWLGSRTGLNLPMHLGMGVQVLEGCLWWSAGFVLLGGLFSTRPSQGNPNRS